MLRRFVHGANPGADDPIAWFEGAAVGSSNSHFVRADARGSVVAWNAWSGAPMHTNTYDEYGIPSASNTGRFQYTGQVWLPEIGLYY